MADPARTPRTNDAIPARGNVRRIAAKTLLALVPLVLLAAVFEFVVSLLGIAPPPANPLIVWNPRRDAEFSSATSEFRENARWLWEPRPGVIAVDAAINEDGFRGPAVPRSPPPPGRVRIAALGDSTTYGIGVPEAAAWPRYLETILRSQGYDVEVLNFGCVGFTAAQGLALYRGRVRDYHPNVVVAAFGSVNEQFPTLPALTDKAKMATLSSPWFRARIVLRRLDAFRWLESKLVDPLIPSAAEIDPKSAVPRVSVDEFRAALLDLATDVRADGGALVLVSPPRRKDGEAESPSTLDYTHALESLAPAQDLPLANVRAAFVGLVAEEFGVEADPSRVTIDQALQSSYFNDPWHPSPKGHRAYAVIVGQTLQERGLLPKKP